VPSTQRDKLRDRPYPVLGNNVAVHHMDGGHLRGPVRYLDWRIEVVSATVAVHPESNLNLPQYAGMATVRHLWDTP
jgi:hypothetical protein